MRGKKPRGLRRWRRVRRTRRRRRRTRRAGRRRRKKPKAKTGLFDALRFVLQKPEVLCLAIMSISQGLSSILFQVAWKGQLRILHPSPQAYSAFMGDVQLMSGALTCIMMLAAPWLFKKLGWAGTLGVTPKSAMILGWAFFGLSIWMAEGGFLVQTSLWLPYLVWGGSILYVIERAAKFSLFKPAEEMVYITLDDESRTKGKAAVDVLGAQVGKTGGSFMQQGLLLWCGTRRRRVARAADRTHVHRRAVVVGCEAPRRHARRRAAEDEQRSARRGGAKEDAAKADGEGGEGRRRPSPPRDAAPRCPLRALSFFCFSDASSRAADVRRRRNAHCCDHYYTARLHCFSPSPSPSPFASRF